YCSELAVAITRSPGTDASLPRTSSERPSAKYALAVSPILSKGSTATLGDVVVALATIEWTRPPNQPRKPRTTASAAATAMAPTIVRLRRRATGAAAAWSAVANAAADGNRLAGSEARAVLTALSTAGGTSRRRVWTRGADVVICWASAASTLEPG